MKKKLIIATCIIIVLLFTIFFIKTYYKYSNSGNNMSNKSLEEIREYILNIESYELVAQITVTSNKTTNKYVVKQQFVNEGNIYVQESLEPENIRGVKFTYNNSELILENAKINLTKVYKDYPYITDNNLSLNGFIHDYTESNEKRCYEDNGLIILETKVKNGNKYTYSKKLYIDKLEGKITKMEISDVTQKTLIYILYKEVKINNLHKEDILAFKITDIERDI